MSTTKALPRTWRGPGCSGSTSGSAGHVRAARRLRRGPDYAAFDRWLPHLGGRDVRLEPSVRSTSPIRSAIPRVRHAVWRRRRAACHLEPPVRPRRPHLLTKPQSAAGRSTRKGRTTRTWRPLAESAAQRQGGTVHAMKAVVQDRYGPPEVLRIEEVARPVPKDDEILIRVRASTVTQTDTHARRPDPFLWRLAFGLRRPRVAYARRRAGRRGRSGRRGGSRRSRSATRCSATRRGISARTRSTSACPSARRSRPSRPA